MHDYFPVLRWLQFRSIHGVIAMRYVVLLLFVSLLAGCINPQFINRSHVSLIEGDNNHQRPFNGTESIENNSVFDGLGRNAKGIKGLISVNPDTLLSDQIKLNPKQPKYQTSWWDFWRKNAPPTPQDTGWTAQQNPSVASPEAVKDLTDQQKLEASDAVVEGLDGT